MNICNPNYTHTQWRNKMFDHKQMTEMAEKFADLYTKTGMTPEKFTDAFKGMMPAVPTVKPNKNGYEIRTKILEMAQNQLWQDYHAKWGAFETTVKKDGDEVVTEVKMPEVPGADAVLEAAEKFYAFVNGNKSSK